MTIHITEDVEVTGSDGEPLAPAVKSKSLQGSLRSTATNLSRDAIPAAMREEGMIVYVKSSAIYYKLGADLLTWTVFSSGGGGGGDATSIQGIPVDPTSPSAAGAVPAYDGASEYVVRRLTLDDIDPAFNITSFAGGNVTLEIGDTLASPRSFTAAYTSTPSAAQIVDNQGNPVLNLVSPFTAGSYPHAYTKTANNATVVWTLTATGATVKTATNTASWRPRVFFGNAVPGAYTEAFIEALASNPLAANRNRTISYNATGAQKAYYAIPSGYGTPTFTVNGFPAAFSLVATVAVTNAFGVTQNYDLWASDLAGLGAFDAVVT